MVQLYDDERLDYLFANESMKIIQSRSVFSFSLDAVLLAHFASVPIAKGDILDLCSGNGVIPLMLSQRTKAKIIGVEIQEKLVNMAERSIQYNQLENQISMIHADLKNIQPPLAQSHFDTVTCNPPYFRTPTKNEQNKNQHVTIAKHEICCTLEDVIKACKLYVKPGGKVTLVHRPGRLVELITQLKAYQLEPKRLQFIYPKKGKEANMLLIEAIRDGKPDLKLLPPLYIYEDDNTYTKEAGAIIYGNN